MAKMKDNTDDILREVDRLISQKLRLAALMVERTAKEKCVVQTGTLRRSILSNWYGATGSRKTTWSEVTKIVQGKKVHVKAGKTEISAQPTKRAIIGTNIEYAPYVELGTKKMSARSYLRPALEANMARIRNLFKAK